MPWAAGPKESAAEAEEEQETAAQQASVAAVSEPPQSVAPLRDAGWAGAAAKPAAPRSEVARQAAAAVVQIQVAAPPGGFPDAKFSIRDQQEVAAGAEVAAAAGPGVVAARLAMIPDPMEAFRESADPARVRLACQIRSSMAHRVAFFPRLSSCRARFPTASRQQS